MLYQHFCQRVMDEVSLQSTLPDSAEAAVAAATAAPADDVHSKMGGDDAAAIPSKPLLGQSEKVFIVRCGTYGNRQGMEVVTRGPLLHILEL
jgi:hypothetical protein